MTPDHEAVVVGSGFSGFGAAVQRKQIDMHDFVVPEKADDLGGTRRDNDYPGLTVDMPSMRPVGGLEHWLESHVFPLSSYAFTRPSTR